MAEASEQHLLQEGLVCALMRQHSVLPQLLLLLLRQWLARDTVRCCCTLLRWLRRLQRVRLLLPHAALPLTLRLQLCMPLLHTACC